MASSPLLVSIANDLIVMLILNWLRARWSGLRRCVSV